MKEKFEVRVEVELTDKEIKFLKKYPADDKYYENDLTLFVSGKRDKDTAEELIYKGILNSDPLGREYFYTKLGEHLSYMLMSKMIRICVVKLDHIRGYEGCEIEIHDFDGTVEEFIREYDGRRFEKYFDESGIVIAGLRDFGFHKSEYDNGYIYDDCNDDIHFIII